MKILTLLTILLITASCSLQRREPSDYEKDLAHSQRLEKCMEKFAKSGYDSEGLVRICGKIYERRQ